MTQIYKNQQIQKQILVFVETKMITTEELCINLKCMETHAYNLVKVNQVSVTTYLSICNDFKYLNSP